MRYIYIYLTESDPTSSSLTFEIYYGDYVNGDTIADIYDPITDTYTTATNISYNDIINYPGVLVAIPETAQYVKLRDMGNFCPDILKLVPLYAEISVTDSYCNNNGTIEIISISGGNGGPYQFKIDSNGEYNSFTGSTLIENLSPRLYSIYIIDGSNFETIITKEIVSYELTGYIGIIKSPTPGNSDGTITLTSYGGVGNRSYKLYRNDAYPIQIPCSGQTLIHTYNGITETNPMITVTGISCGSYCLEVTDGDGCKYYDNNVSVCVIPLDNVQTLTVTLNDYTPYGASSFNGMVYVQSNLITPTITSSGGTLPYHYEWQEVDNMDGLTINNRTGSTRFSAYVECKATYTGTFRLKVTDDSGTFVGFSDIATVTLENNYPGVCTNN